MEGFIARGQELVAALAQPGIQTTSFIALIGAAGTIGGKPPTETASTVGASIID